MKAIHKPTPVEFIQYDGDKHAIHRFIHELLCNNLDAIDTTFDNLNKGDYLVYSPFKKAFAVYTEEIFHERYNVAEDAPLGYDEYGCKIVAIDPETSTRTVSTGMHVSNTKGNAGTITNY